jgi:hypothetical protein
MTIFWNFFHVNSTNFANFFKKFVFPNFLFQEFEEKNPNSGIFIFIFKNSFS